jgi:RNase_H superfamily
MDMAPQQQLVVFDLETDRLLNATRDNWADLRVTAFAAVLSPLPKPMSEETGCEEDGQGGQDARVVLYAPVWPPEDATAALQPLAAALDAAERLVAYNGREFDLRVLLNYYARERVDGWSAKLADPFELIRAATRSWVSLDELLLANGLPGKQPPGCSGVDAVAWWAAGERDRVADYCRQDAEALHALVTRSERLRFPVKRWTRAGAQVVERHAKLRWRTALLGGGSVQ